MRVADIGCHFQPLSCLIVGVDTGCVSLEVGVVHDAAVIEVTQTSVITEIVLCSAYGEVVFLSE